jgi:hypothetical protein
MGGFAKWVFPWRTHALHCSTKSSDRLYILARYNNVFRNVDTWTYPNNNKAFFSILHHL